MNPSGVRGTTTFNPFVQQSRPERPKGLVREAEGAPMMKKMLRQQKAAAMNPFTKPAEVTLEDPPEKIDVIDTIMRARFSKTDARKAYLALADVAIYNADPTHVKDQIKTIFKELGDAAPEAYLSKIMGIHWDDYRIQFFITLDWKAEVMDLHTAVETALGDKHDKLKLPSQDGFGRNATIVNPDVLEAYNEALTDGGIEIHVVGDGSDTYTAILTPAKSNKRVMTLLGQTHVAD